jgi:hypothetical protein
MTQRDMMRQLVERFGQREDVVVREHARAERAGLVERKSDSCSISPEGHASVDTQNRPLMDT